MAVISERSDTRSSTEAVTIEWRPPPISSPVHALRNSLEISWNEADAVRMPKAVTPRRLGSIFLLGAIAWIPLTTILYLWSQ